MFPISQRRSGNIKPTIDITLRLPTKTKDLGELQEIHKTGRLWGRERQKTCRMSWTPWAPELLDFWDHSASHPIHEPWTISSISSCLKAIYCNGTSNWLLPGSLDRRIRSPSIILVAWKWSLKLDNSKNVDVFSRTNETPIPIIFPCGPFLRESYGITVGNHCPSRCGGLGVLLRALLLGGLGFRIPRLRRLERIAWVGHVRDKYVCVCVFVFDE